jgi:8-oxo-dGTP diphosphatase
MDHVDIRKAGGVFIKDRRFLVTRSYGKDMFVAPGGKLEPGETATAALIREIMEEIQIEITEMDMMPLGTFQAQAAGTTDKTIEMKVFLIKNMKGEPTPSSEIEEIMWINTHTTGIQLGSIFEHNVMPLLRKMDLID